VSREDDERLWNLIVFKVYATDRELEDAAPFILGVLAVIAVVAFCFWLFWSVFK
jgi:hypothetical protein